MNIKENKSNEDNSVTIFNYDKQGNICSISKGKIEIKAVKNLSSESLDSYELAILDARDASNKQSDICSVLERTVEIVKKSPSIYSNQVSQEDNRITDNHLHENKNLYEEITALVNEDDGKKYNSQTTDFKFEAR